MKLIYPIVGVVVFMGASLWLMRSTPVADDVETGGTGLQREGSREPVAANTTAGAHNASGPDAGTFVSESPDRSSGSRPHPEASGVEAAQPIEVSPGFESFLAPSVEPSELHPGSVIVRQHRKLQSEVRDEAWAGSMESDIRTLVQGELASSGADANRIEFRVLECRTSGCEIQAVGYPEDNGKQGRDLQLILPGMMLGPLARDFDPESLSMTLTVLPDGRIAFVAFMTRKQP